MIAGDWDGPGKPLNTSYILEVFFNDTTIIKIEYKLLPDVPHSFLHAAFGSFKGRSLIMGGEDSNKCFEFDQEKYHVLPSLNVNRQNAASTFIQNKIVIAGGHCNGNVLDTIEILEWDESNHGFQWIQSPSRLPIKVRGHTLVTFNNKLYLIGGSDGSNMLDTIWEGILDLGSKISWVESGFRLQSKRTRHFSFVISNQIVIFGGRGLGGECDDVVEIIEGNELKQGPKVPFRLHAFSDQVVLDRKNRIIITSNKRGLIVYNHQEGTFRKFPLILTQKQQGSVVILQ